MSGFGDAPRKIEGQAIWGEYETKPRLYETTWLEVPIPVALEELAYSVIKAITKQWLIDNGFEEDEL